MRDRGICKGIKKTTFLGVVLRPTGLLLLGGLDLCKSVVIIHKLKYNVTVS